MDFFRVYVASSELGEFETVLQTRDPGQGLQNYWEFLQLPESCRVLS